MKLSWIDPSGMPIVLTDVHLNLCDFLADFHNPCPWKPGTHHISYNNQYWSDLFPTVRHDCVDICIDFIIIFSQGKYEAKLVATDNNGKDEMFCFIFIIIHIEQMKMSMWFCVYAEINYTFSLNNSLINF